MSAPSVVVRSVFGREITRYIDDLAALRIEVFRAYPYLYDGDVGYERAYLAEYAAHAQSVVVVASDGATVIGAATAMPLLAHGESVSKPVADAGFDPSQVYYFGESVLRSAYRGQRIGHAFFDHREAAARQFGFAGTAFCAVDRGVSHPARPVDYVPHDKFWTGRGFVRRPDIVARMAWRDVGDTVETSKPLPFWFKTLGVAQ